MKTFAVYIRVSTEKQVQDGNGLDVQLNALNNYAVLNDLEIQEYYIDKGRSATSKKRPEYTRLFKDVVAGRVKWLMVYKRDRLVRDVADLFEVNEILSSKCGCRVESLKEGLLSWNNASDKFLSTIMAAKDRLEVEQVSERTIDALYASALKGNYVYGGKLPVGFRRCERNGANKAIEPIPELIASILELFELIAKGEYNCNSICALLNARNFLDDHKWTEQKVRKIITSEIYIGNHVSERWRIDDHTPATISKELFEAANEALAVLKLKNTYIYLFENIYCAKCNSKLVRETTRSNKRTRKLFTYYRCKNCNIRINEQTLISDIGPFIDKKFLDIRKLKIKSKSIVKERAFKKCVVRLNSLLIGGEINRHSYVSEIFKAYNTHVNLPVQDREKRLFHELSLEEKKLYVHENIKRILLDPYLNTFVVNCIDFN